jgi:hypothetical protein
MACNSGVHQPTMTKVKMSFSSLSLELRWEIWQLVALEEPRTFQLRVFNPKDPLIGRHCVVEYHPSPLREGSHASCAQVFLSEDFPTLPLVLQICQESRREGLRTYERIDFNGVFMGYFNLRRDTLFFPPELWACLEGWSQKNHFRFGCFSRLEHLAIYVPGFHPEKEFPSGQYMGKIVKRLTHRMFCAFGREVLPELRTLTYFYDRARRDQIPLPDEDEGPHNVVEDLGGPPSDSFAHAMRYCWATEEPFRGFKGGPEVQFEFKLLPTNLRWAIHDNYLQETLHPFHGYFCWHGYMLHLCAVCNPRERKWIFAQAPTTVCFHVWKRG